MAHQPAASSLKHSRNLLIYHPLQVIWVVISGLMDYPHRLLNGSPHCLGDGQSRLDIACYYKDPAAYTSSAALISFPG
jgi:hypothetical protein